MKDIKWFKTTEEEKTEGINSVAFAYKNKEYIVVMVSRMGDFGLSETGQLPYSIRVDSKDVKKIDY